MPHAPMPGKVLCSFGASTMPVAHPILHHVNHQREYDGYDVSLIALHLHSVALPSPQDIGRQQPLVICLASTTTGS